MNTGFCTIFKNEYCTCGYEGIISVETTVNPVWPYCPTDQLVPGRVVTIMVRLSVTTPGTNSSGP